MTNKTAMQQAWEIEERTNPHTAYNSWCRGYEAGRKDENEACAKVCDEQYEYYGYDHVFAAKIRARMKP